MVHRPIRDRIENVVCNSMTTAKHSARFILTFFEGGLECSPADPTLSTSTGILDALLCNLQRSRSSGCQLKLIRIEPKFHFGVNLPSDLRTEEKKPVTSTLVDDEL